MSTAEAPSRDDLLTIGAVCRLLKDEFPDISISKIRYLEDQRLLEPKRTQGGYRLFAPDDLERLRTILRLQRDEFLPLRVIRQELKSLSGKERRRKRGAAVDGEEELTLDELCERAGITMELAHELEAYGLLESASASGEKHYAEADVEIAEACAKLSRFGIAPRNCARFKTSAESQLGMLGQIVAPSLHARNAERRASALEDLQTLGELVQELSGLLFWRDLRRLAGS